MFEVIHDRGVSDEPLRKLTRLHLNSRLSYNTIIISHPL